MADQKISALTAHTAPIATDVLPIVDVTAGETKKIPLSALFTKYAGSFSQANNNNTSKVIAHGLGRIPTGMTLFFKTSGGAGFGTYDGTNQQCASWYSTTADSSDTTHIGSLRDANGSCLVTASWDATNVTLAIAGGGQGGTWTLSYLIM